MIKQINPYHQLSAVALSFLTSLAASWGIRGDEGLEEDGWVEPQTNPSGAASERGLICCHKSRLLVHVPSQSGEKAYPQK